jgi:mannose-6-phosphate isomerase-like protein (cupin superfamily)
VKIIESVKDVDFRKFPGGDMFAVLIGRHESTGSSNEHTVAIVKLPAGSESDEHFHKEREESYYIIEGEGVAIIDGVETKISAGSLVFTKPLERHQFRNIGKLEMSYLIVTAPVWIPEDSHS